MARTHSHDTLVELAVHATVPVINGLSDLFHPCQLLADHLTLREVFGDVEGLRVAFVGDGNNVCHSHINAAVHTGIALTIACTPAAAQTWVKTEGTGGADRVNGLVARQGGGLLLAGTQDPEADGQPRAWLLAVDALGVHVRA